MRILITGATGMAGSEVVRQALSDPKIIEIIALSRRPLSMHHEKITTIMHSDFLNYNGLDFRNCSACIWCLGISQSQVNKDQYQVITHDYTVAGAQAMFKCNPTMTFVFLSGAGADLKEKSPALFGRIKGKTENSLSRIGFTKIFMARPAGIKPIHKNPRTALVNKIIIPFYPLIQLILPAAVISSAQLAQAMLYVAKHGWDKKILDNQELKKIAIAYGAEKG